MHPRKNSLCCISVSFRYLFSPRRRDCYDWYWRFNWLCLENTILPWHAAGHRDVYIVQNYAFNERGGVTEGWRMMMMVVVVVGRWWWWADKVDELVVLCFFCLLFQYDQSGHCSLFSQDKNHCLARTLSLIYTTFGLGCLARPPVCHLLCLPCTLWPRMYVCGCRRLQFKPVDS